MIYDNEKELDIHIDKTLTSIEERICNRVSKWYNGLRIMVSIQVLHSSQRAYRNPPCNTFCEAVQSVPDQRKLCDKSDDIAKRFLYQQIRGKQGQQLKLTTLGYRCHRNLSNIVLPVREMLDNLQTDWYIFLGQFFLLGCTKKDEFCSMNVNKCYGNCNLDCPQGFESERIRILQASEITKKYEDCIKYGLFYNCEQQQEEVQNIEFLTIPQMLICKYIAQSIFTRFLKRIGTDERSKDMRTNFKNWIEILGSTKKVGAKAGWQAGPKRSTTIE